MGRREDELEERTFGAVAHGGTAEDRLLNAAGVPDRPLLDDTPPELLPRPVELARDEAGEGVLPGQASMSEDAPNRCQRDAGSDPKRGA